MGHPAGCLGTGEEPLFRTGAASGGRPDGKRELHLQASIQLRAIFSVGSGFLFALDGVAPYSSAYHAQ